MPVALAQVSFEEEGKSNFETVKQPEKKVEPKKEEPKKSVDKKEKSPKMIGASETQQKYIDYAWEISKDETFIYLLKAENGLISHDRKHPISYILCDNSKGITVPPSNCNNKKKGFYWKKHYDWGFCGISDGYYKGIVDDERFLNDWKWQMGECLRLYKGGTKFYGLKNIGKTKKLFTWE